MASGSCEQPNACATSWSSPTLPPEKRRLTRRYGSDRFLAASIAWQKEWHLQDGVYVRQLKKRIRAASIRVEPNVRGALEQALSYIKQMTRSSLY
jgi:hypothetical protein